MPESETVNDRTQIEITFADEAIVLDASGALYIPDRGTLIVSDLHLEKGSFFAVRGQPMPCHDTRDTLLRLSEAIRRYCPSRLVCLGDSFHDVRADERMDRQDAAILNGLMGQCQDWIWVTGNHDPEIPPEFGGRCAASARAGAIHLIHCPEDGIRPLIAGHYHPKYQFRAAGRSVSGPCFVIGAEILLMPAFGAYAGGLSALSEPVAVLFDHAPRYHALLYGSKIWRLE